MIGDLKQIFLESSFVFADEVTEELYRLLFGVLRVVVEGRKDREMEELGRINK